MLFNYKIYIKIDLNFLYNGDSPDTDFIRRRCTSNLRMDLSTEHTKADAGLLGKAIMLSAHRFLNRCRFWSLCGMPLAIANGVTSFPRIYIW